MKRSLLLFMFLLLGHQIAYAEIIPRVGAEIAVQDFIYFDGQTNPVNTSVGPGINFGAVYVTKSFFIDLNAETANTNTMVNDGKIFAKGWRSEMSMMLGYKLMDNFWLSAGKQYLSYGKSIFGSERGTMESPALGFSLTNMQVGEYLFTVGLSWTIAVSSENINGTKSEKGFNGGMRLAWRKKGSPHLWTWKQRAYTPDLEGADEEVMKLSYSYLFL